MNIKNKFYILAFMLIASSSAYSNIKVLADGKDKSADLSATNIILKDDFVKKLEKYKEKQDMIDQLEYGYISRGEHTKYYLNEYDNPDVLGKTGIFFDYTTKADDLAAPQKISGKDVTIINGGIGSDAMPYSYEGTQRVGIIENSKIDIIHETLKETSVDEDGNTESKTVPKRITYIPHSDDSIIKESNYLPQEYKDRAYRESKYKNGNSGSRYANMPDVAIDIFNSKLIFKNSEVKITPQNLAHTWGSEGYYKGSSAPAIKITSFYGNPTFLEGVISTDKNYTGLEFQRDVKDANVYDLDTNRDINIETIYNWEGKDLLRNNATPYFKVGANTRIRARTLNVMANQRNVDYSTFFSSILAGTREDKGIIFEKDSEVELRNIDSGSGNIYLDGGKLSLGGLKIDPRNGDKIEMQWDIVKTNSSIFRGSAIFDVYGVYWFNGPEPSAETKAGNYTNLVALPGSKFDLNYFANGRFQTNYNTIETEEDVEETDKGELFQFTFKDNSHLYLSQVAEADIIMDKGSHLYLYREFDKDKIVEAPDKKDWDDYDAHVYYDKEAYLLTDLEKYGSANMANEVQFRQKLTLNDAHIYFRTNIAKQLADRLIVKNNIITGSGTTTLHINNQGGADTNGKEKVVLIEARKGVDSGVKFVLDKKAIEIGAYEYVLGNKIVDDGNEYFLVSTLSKGTEDENRTGIKNDPSNVEKPNFSKTLAPIKNQDFNLVNQDVKVNSDETSKLAIALTNNKANIENSKLVVENGDGIKLEDSPLTIKNSNVYLDTRDTNTGLNIKGTNSSQPLLKVERNSASDSDTRDLFVNGKLKIAGNPADSKKTNTIFGKNTKVEVYNPKGDSGLSIKDSDLTIENGATTILESKTALYSENSTVNGNGTFKILGNIIHEGNKKFNLTFDKGSVVDSPSIQIERVAGSNLHFKDGSDLRVSKISNADIVMDKGSRLYLYSQKQAKETVYNNRLDTDSTDLGLNGYDPGLNKGNTVIFSGRTELNDIDLYTRINLTDNLADRMIVEGTNGILTGKGATVHLINAANLDISNINLTAELFRGNLDPNFKWNIANELEIGSYIYDAKLNLRKNSATGESILSYDLKDRTQRTAKLTSTADSFIENTFADYYTELGSVDSIFRGIDTTDFSKKDNVWAKIDGTSLTTKNGFKANGKTVLAGIDRQLLNHESLHAGIFIGDTQTDKSYSKFSGKGKSNIFHAGIYLTYRGIIGDGDFILKYSTGKTDYNVLDTAGDKITNKYDYKSKVVGFRFAKKIYPMNKGFYIEPSVKASYGEIDAVDATASNGLNTKVKGIRSWSTGGELRVGYNKNNLNAYTKVGIAKEFLGDVDVNFNKKGEERRQLDEGMLTFGAGLEYSLGNHSLSLEAERKQSKLLKDFYRVSVGYKYKF